MLSTVFLQGYLDSLCGVYCIVNAEKLINNSSQEQSQRLFNSIIRYLDDEEILSSSIIGGMDYANISYLIRTKLSNRLLVIENKKRFANIDKWWESSMQFMSDGHSRAIIISIGGRENHVTVVKSMSDRGMVLSDSGRIKLIRRTACELKGYKEDDKYIIYPYQCIYLSNVKGE